VNAAAGGGAVPAPSDAALAFHRALEGYAPTPVRELPAIAGELGLGAVLLKDESDRLGLPAFKVLGASWAIERALREQPGIGTLVAASAGNHGRAVAHVARRRGLRARIFLPERSLPARREAIASEGADVIVVDGGYEEAVADAEAAGEAEGVLLIADVGESGPAHDVIDGYATLFAEAAEQAAFDTIVVPVGVGSLAAAAARHGAATGVTVIGVEPSTAACLTASLAAGRPSAVETPGTVMAGLDCAEVSPAAWPSLRAGIHGTVTVTDEEVARAVAELASAGLDIGESGAAPLAALRRLTADASCRALGASLGPASRVLLIATEGPTGIADPTPTAFSHEAGVLPATRAPTNPLRAPSTRRPTGA
jgi:diaminopropionate ammonia-lyase